MGNTLLHSIANFVDTTNTILWGNNTLIQYYEHPQNERLRLEKAFKLYIKCCSSQFVQKKINR